MRHSTCAHRRTRREDSMEDLQKDKDQGEKLRSLVEVSRKNDIPALLNAKNRAQQDVYSDPSKENLAVLERATAMLEKAMDAGQNCKNWKEALTYLQEDCGRKIGQTKLFADIKAGRLRKQPDGTFKRRDLDRYAASLPTAGTPDKLATDAARRQREKEEQEIRRIRAVADKEEFILKVKQGQYISRDDVYQELAARAVALSASLKTEFEARSLDVIALVEGNPKKSGPFVEAGARLPDQRAGIENEHNTHARVQPFSHYGREGRQRREVRAHPAHHGLPRRYGGSVQQRQTRRGP